MANRSHSGDLCEVTGVQRCAAHSLPVDTTCQHLEFPPAVEAVEAGGAAPKAQSYLLLHWEEGASKCPHQFGLWTKLWCILLVDDYCGRV